MGKRAAGYFGDPSPADPSSDPSLPPIVEQHRRFIEHCSVQGYDVVATFVDGREAEHEPPAFESLLALVQRDPADLVVIVDHPSVLAPDARLAARRIYELRSAGVTVEVSGAPEHDLLDDLFASLVDGHGVAPPLADRVREAMRRKAVKGEVLGRSPYGYRAGTRHRLEPVPAEVEVVRYIFRMYVQEELGIRLVARRLNEEGYRTRRGGAWSMVTIRDILRNRAYLGTYARFGVRVPGSHQALITSDEFRRAQERMVSRRTSGGPRSVSSFLLSGLAICGACGGHMIGVSRRQRWTRRSDGGVSTAEYRYYQCGSRTNQSVCDYHTHRAEALEVMVRETLIKTLETDRSAPAGSIAPRPVEPVDALQQQVEAAERELDRLIQRIAARPHDRARLHQRALDAARAKQEARVRLAAQEAGEREAAEARMRAEVWSAALRGLRDGWDGLEHDARRALLESVLERVIVHDDHVDVMLHP